MPFVPIGTIPGLTSNLDAVDILVFSTSVALNITRIMLRHTDYDDGGATDTSVVGVVAVGTGGGDPNIAFTIPDQTQSVTVTETEAVAAGESVYVRVTTGSASQNLTGWVEVSDANGVTTALTNLVTVKRSLSIATTTNDALLTDLIAGVSDELAGAMHTPILQATATDERHDSIGDHRLVLDNHPVISITSVAEDGTALVEDTDYEATERDLERGALIRYSSTYYTPIGWARGLRNISATYVHGYATVPGAVLAMATDLVSFDYRQSVPGGGRMGLEGKVLPEGGASTYTTREALWAQQKHRLAKYTRVWF